MLPLLLGPLPRSIVPRGALPVPAHGGRALWVIVVPRVVAPKLPPFDGRFEELLPNPAGGRPRSEESPCASHVRPVGRVLDPPLTPALPRGELLLLNPRFALPSALARMFEFGLSRESLRSPGDIAPPFSGV